MKDVLGVEVEVGCTVAYPRRQSSSCWLGSGRVVGVDEARGRVRLDGGRKRTCHGRPKVLRPRWVAGGDHVVVTKGAV